MVIGRRNRMVYCEIYSSYFQGFEMDTSFFDVEDENHYDHFGK